MLPVAQPAAQVALPPGQKAMVCPRCSMPATFHPDSQRWGCDRCRAFLDTMWPFNTQGKPANRSSQGMKMIFGGIGLILLGAVITGATHEAAVSNGGGTYFIAYGPIVVGVMLLFRGLYQLVV